jgi:alcohol dehydrogenase class IV
MNANWNYPTAVRFGAGRIAELPDACRALGMSRPLLISDPFVAKLAFTRDAIGRNAAAGLPTGLFADIKPNPVGRNVEDGVRAYHAGGHDGVIALGGGSALDAAKAVALMVGQTRPIWDFEDVGDNWTRVNVAGVAPVVALATTAGTGSEVGRSSVIIQEEAEKKRIIFHPKMQPAIVICDPELTFDLPAPVTAATGMDALAHCLEAYCVDWYHPMADGIALEGMRLIKDWLPVACTEPRNVTARGNMMSAAAMGATAFQKGLGAIHSLAHPLGVFYDKHHGLLNAVLMPYVLAFNGDVIAEKMRRLGRYLDLADASTAGVIDWVLALRRQIGIPHTLADIGIDLGRADEVADHAAHDPTAPSNPRKLDAPLLRGLFENAVAGRL